MTATLDSVPLEQVLPTVLGPTLTHYLILVCKRIIGMEHDYITNEDGKIIKVPKGHVWIEGDNKADSEDSRDYGPVPYGLLESRVFFRWWPTRRMGPIKLPGEEDILETRMKSGLYLSRSKESEEQ